MHGSLSLPLSLSLFLSLPLSLPLSPSLSLSLPLLPLLSLVGWFCLFVCSRRSTTTPVFGAASPCTLLVFALLIGIRTVCTLTEHSTPHRLLTLHTTPHTSHCTLHTAHWTLHTPHSTPHRTLHTAHSTLHTLHHTAHSTLHTPHSTLHTPHCTLHNAHHTHRTGHVTSLHCAHHTPLRLPPPGGLHFFHCVSLFRYPLNALNGVVCVQFGPLYGAPLSRRSFR